MVKLNINSLRIVLAFVVLIFTSRFTWSNIIDLEEGSGYLYLQVAAISGAVLFLFSRRYSAFFRVKRSRSAVLLALFFFYFLIRHAVEVEELGDIWGITIGTSGGVFFAFSLGLLLSFAFSELLLYGKDKRRMVTLIGWLACGYMVYELWSSYEAYKGHFMNVRSDVFLVNYLERGYQRPGDLMIMQFAVVSFLVGLLSVLRPALNSIFLWLSLPLYFAIAGVLMVTSQLIGSNKGLAVIAMMSLVVPSYLSVSRLLLLPTTRMRLTGVWGRLGRRALLTASGVAIAAVVAAVLFSNYLPFTWEELRVLNFGEGRVGSLESRYGLFVENFLEHVTYAPLFGHPYVDQLTTGRGTYIHSLFSVQPHLGMVGFVLLAGYFIALYAELVKVRRCSSMPYREQCISLFRLFFLSTVISVAIVAAFFTWMPLWFSIGLWGIGSARGYPASVR